MNRNALTRKNRENPDKRRKQGKQQPSSSTKTARIVLIATVGGIAAIVGLAIVLSGGFTNKLTSPAEQRLALMSQVLAPTTPAAFALESPASDPKVTIVEFGDYQCNSCTLFHKVTKDKVMSDLVNTGKAKFMFKDFVINDAVLQPRGASTLAAEAAYCAGDQGKYWQYYDELYNNQKSEGTVWVSVQALDQFAKNIGVQDMDQFSHCLNSHIYKEKVDQNSKLAQKLGINATPTFVITAEGKEPQIVVGAQPYSAFEQIVKQMSAS